MINNIHLFTVLLSLMVIWGCGKDSEDLGLDQEISISGLVLNNQVTEIGGGLSTIREQQIEEVEVNVYLGTDLIAQTISDRTGSYKLNFDLKQNSRERLLIEVLKEGYLQSVNVLESVSQNDLDLYLIKIKFNVDNEVSLNLDQDIIAIRGIVDYENRFNINVKWESLEGDVIQSRFSARDSFLIAIPQNSINVEIKMFNEIGCEATIQDGLFTSTFTSDIHYGNLTNEQIFIPPMTELSYQKPRHPNCVNGGQVILNGQVMIAESAESAFTCTDIEEFEIVMINYENYSRTELKKFSPRDFESIEFTECISYPYEFEITTEFGIFTNETEGAKVLTCYYSDFIINETTRTLNLELQLNDEWIFGLSLRLIGFVLLDSGYPNINCSPNLLRLRKIGERVSSLSRRQSLESGDIAFTIRDGYFGGRKENVQQNGGGETRFYGYDCRVPVIE